MRFPCVWIQGVTILSIELRKEDHIELALKPENQGPLTTLLEDVSFIHYSLADLSYDNIDLEVEFLGFRLGGPILISAMTGGTSRAYEINKKLAEIAEKYRFAIGVGSQRMMIINPDTLYTYKIVRDIAQSVPVIANIGIAQITKLGLPVIERIVEAIEANALAIHLNVLQELAQPEGDKDFQGSINAIRRLAEYLRVPVIVKEVGMGISRECAEVLYRIGVKIIDVAGAGGTNWVSIELMRAKSNEHVNVFSIFKTWGLPTAISITEVASIRDVVVVGSGGIRNGLEVAKAIALGADIVGIAQPFLYHLINNTIDNYVKTLLTQLKVTMFLANSKTINELKSAKIVILGKLASWVCSRRLKLRNANAYIFCHNLI